MNEIQQATTNNLGCPQPGYGNEDCLSLNVYTPQVLKRVLTLRWENSAKMLRHHGFKNKF